MSRTSLHAEFEIFAKVIESEDRDWISMIDALCAGDEVLAQRVKALVESHRRAERDESGVRRAAAPGAIEPAWIPRIDRYEITTRLGEGGMGVVYAAEQTEPIQRRVAIKLLKSLSDSREVIARFEAERQTLAMMRHPTIASILDAGVFEGRPYFVMELIEGQPITEYCDGRSLSVRDRLGLFVRVCEGVQHAHQKGVIHRDLKPSNVLVTDEHGEPVPKIIDFGIAKATRRGPLGESFRTEIGQVIGTPDYMSPEQADGAVTDIDTRTDVYSLGALLYELLCGATVFGLHQSRASIDRIRATIADQTPVRPSERTGARGHEPERPELKTARGAAGDLTRVLRQDLDWITLKALEKEPARRYASASELAADVRRFLAGETVVARPPSASYRVSKFVRRHKGTVVAAAAVVGALLIAGGAVSWSAVTANRERAIAQDRAADLERVVRFQDTRLQDVDPQQMGEGIKASILDHLSGGERADVESALAPVNFTNVAMASLDETILNKAVRAIDEEFADDPAIRAELLQSIGLTMVKLGLVSNALGPHTRALDLRMELFGEEHPLTTSSISDVGVTLAELGRFDEAEPYYRRAYEQSLARSGEQHESTIDAANNLAHLLQQRGRLDEALSMYENALRAARLALGNEHRTTIRLINNMGYILHERGEVDEAEVFMTEAVSLARAALPPDDPERLSAVTNLGGSLVARGRLREGLPYFEEALGGFRRANGDTHPNTLILVSNMGYLLQELGDFERAREHYIEALNARRETLGPQHPMTLLSASNLGNLLQEMGDLAGAEPLLRETYEARRHLLGESHPSTINSCLVFASLLRQTGNLDESLRLTRLAIDETQRSLPEEHALRPSALSQHARSLLAQSDYQAAASCAMDAYDHYVAHLGPAHPKTKRAADFVQEILQSWPENDPSTQRNAAIDAWGARRIE